MFKPPFGRLFYVLVSIVSFESIIRNIRSKIVIGKAVGLVD